MKVINRKEVEDLIYRVFDKLDPTGINTDHYRNIFSVMKDEEFAKFMKSFLDDEKDNFAFQLIDYENKLDMQNCENAANELKIPLMEYVYLPHLNRDHNNVIVTKEKCLVGYYNVKRTQQMLHKKNGMTINNEKVSMLTGQVINEDKNSRNSDIEATMLVSIGADKILQEFHGPRSDDMVMKREMEKSIAQDGYVELESLTNDPRNKTTLNTVNTYLLAAALKTDLITDSYILPKTQEDMGV